MKVIGNRISILKKENLLSIVILAINDKKKLGLMFVWLLAWSVCGIIVLANYFQLSNQQAKLFIIIYLSFWAYFEFKIVRSFIWKKYGKEKLWITNGILHYQQEINGKGKINEFNLDMINDLQIIEQRPASFADTFNQSFWVKGGERLQFTSQAKVVAFGMQITDEEARAILNEMKSFIKQSK